MFRFKRRPKNEFSFRENWNVTKSWKKKKKHFPNGIFSEIWLKVGEHEYIYIFEIKFEKKKILLLKSGDQNKFCEIAQ